MRVWSASPCERSHSWQEAHPCSRPRASHPTASPAWPEPPAHAAAQLFGRIRSNPHRPPQPLSAKSPFHELGLELSVCHSYHVCNTDLHDSQPMVRVHLDTATGARTFLSAASPKRRPIYLCS